MSLSTPTSDWQYSLLLDGTTGETVVDVVLTNTGDIKQVTGINRLVQMVQFALITARGANALDPSYGNPFITELTRPAQSDATIYQRMLDQTEADFLARQGADAAAGYLSQDELVDHFEHPLPVGIASPGTLNVPFTIVAASQARANTSLGLGSTTGG